MASGKKVAVIFVVAVVLMISLVYVTKNISKITGKAVADVETNEEELAKCLTREGAKMYGAYWCGHCQNQKKLFGDSFQYIDYIECDAKGENPNPAACSSAGIEGYPTWVISGKKYPGEQSFEKLKELSNC